MVMGAAHQNPWVAPEGSQALRLWNENRYTNEGPGERPDANPVSERKTGAKRPWRFVNALRPDGYGLKRSQSCLIL